MKRNSLTDKTIRSTVLSSSALGLVALIIGLGFYGYTDGVPEAANRENELFGMERMLAALNEGPDDTPQDTLKNVRRAVDAFVHGAEQFDDLTMLCLEYKGPLGQEGRAP